MKINQDIWNEQNQNMGCNASVEDGEENPQSSALGKSEKGELSLQRICFYQLQL